MNERNLFCENEMCINHEKMPMEILLHGKMTHSESGRKLIHRNEHTISGKSIFLCDGCSNAIKIYIKKSLEASKGIMEFLRDPEDD